MTIANHYRSDDARKASDGRFVDADQRAPNMVPGIEARIGWPDDAVIDGQRLRSDPKNRRGPIHKKAQCLRCGSLQDFALSWIVSLAIVGPWSAATALSPSTIATRPKETSSSSAMICADPVAMPAPRST
jgi:hypothetical protein